jgi:Zn-dependent membrane protease YugP
MNWYYHKKVGLNMLRFWKNLLPILLIGGSLSVTTLLLGQMINLYHFVTWAVCVILFIVVYALLLWLFVLKPSEKELFAAPIRKITKRFRKKS